MALRIIRFAQNFQRTPLASFRYNLKDHQYKSALVQVCAVKYCSTRVVEDKGWNTWKGIVTKFVPIGLCLLAVMQWRAYRRHTSTRTAAQWEINFYCALPLRMFSRCFGWLADKRLPEMIRPWVYGAYVSTFKVNLSEAACTDLKQYPSLADFFARALRDGVRMIDCDSCLTSPCDGRVLHFGPVNSCYVEQVKGVTYSLQRFLGDNTWTKPKECTDYRTSLLIEPENKPTTLYQCILYLAPGDYHRFHSPAVWQPRVRRHFSGELLSVNPKIAKWIPELFCLNERAVYIGQWKHGFFSLAAVGATNVGSVRVYFDKALHTNTRSHLNVHDDVILPNGINLKKGDAFGEFRMGSTIVLIFEAPANFEFNLKVGQQVQMGQGIGGIRKLKYVDKIHKPEYHEIKSAS